MMDALTGRGYLGGRSLSDVPTRYWQMKMMMLNAYWLPRGVVNTPSLCGAVVWGSVNTKHCLHY